MHFLFIEENLIEKTFYEELQSAKELRVETQYYFIEELDTEKIKEDSKTAKKFVLKMEELIENINEEQIKLLRKKLESLNF